MSQDQMIYLLNTYIADLSSILERFTTTRDRMWIGKGDDSKLRQLVQEVFDLLTDEIAGGSVNANEVRHLYYQSTSNDSGSPSYYWVEALRSYLSAVVARVRRSPACLKSLALMPGQVPTGPQRTEVLYRIGERFHLVARQLRVRHAQRSTLDVGDEYDVQDLFHSLLRIAFDDVRSEEWVPSYAGGASRMDFLLPEIEAVVEIKKSRQGLGAKELGEQLIIDIVKYKKHPACRILFCFVYDPDGRINNPRGIENDLNASQSDLTVRVMIAP